MHDYLREIDLNPPAGPITSLLDPRAMHYFGFTADGQEVAIVQPFAGQPRVLVSFHYGNQPTAAPPQPQPPIDAIVDFSAGPPMLRYEANHERAHVLVWLDPAVVPPRGAAGERSRPRLGHEVADQRPVVAFPNAEHSEPGSSVRGAHAHDLH